MVCCIARHDPSGTHRAQYVRAMSIEIAPALKPDEWEHRRCGAVSIDRVDGETHVVVTDPDGEIVGVSGPEEVATHDVITSFHCVGGREDRSV